MLHCTNSLGILTVIFAQVFLGTIISLIYLLLTKTHISLTMSRKDFIFYFGRGSTNAAAMTLSLFALSNLGINEATALGYTGPLWVFIMAKYFIGEKFSIRILILVATNMLGMFIILRPKLLNMPWEGIVAALGATLLWSIYEVICKKQSDSQHYMLQAFYFFAISSTIMAPFVISSWKTINLAQGSSLVGIAALAVVNVSVLFLAYARAPLMLLAPIGYTRLVFTVIITSIIYNISPSISTLVGAAIIIVANGYITYSLKKVVHVPLLSSS